MNKGDFIMSDEFDELAKKGGMKAREETLKKGLPVFFGKNGLQLKEEPNGTIYEIEYKNVMGLQNCEEADG